VKWLSDATLKHLRQVADEPDLTGTKYDLIGRLGQGGMASVYLAHDRDLDRPVALKVLRDPVADPSLAARLAEEARIVARLEHPGIVPVHDVGVLPDGRFYYAMKQVRGKRLDELVQTATPLAERLRWFEKVCDAVAFAHAHGVIHRDLKPQNIMVGAFGEVLVMDWGVARRLEEPVPAAAHGAVLGTPGYMAPEQERGDVAHTDERADVYALGGLLSFLLGDPSPPRALRAIVGKARAAEQKDRYESVPALARDIASYLAGERVRAYPESVFGTARRLASKYRVALVLVLAYLAMRILLLFGSGP
jgi:serine/threonine protein kinase